MPTTSSNLSPFSPGHPTTTRRFIGKYELCETLGRGMSGKVKKGVHRESGESVALKIIDKYKATKRTLSQLHTEIVALKTLNHPNVIRLQNVELEALYKRSNGEEVPSIVLALQLAERGELFNYMMHAGFFPELVARTFFSQLLSVLQFCHEKGIFHRDIKPENLLLDSNYQLKVADFGLSAIRSDPNALLHTECGTKLYMAPEVLAHEEYNGAKADLWSAGVLLFIMLAGNPPFQVAKQGDWWFNCISKNDYDKFWRAHKKYAPHFPIGGQEFLSQILLPEPELRPDAETLQECSWMKSPILSPIGLKQEMNNRRLEMEGEQRAARESERRKVLEQRQQLYDTKVNIVQPPPSTAKTSAVTTNQKRPINNTASTAGSAVRNFFDPFMQNTYRDINLSKIRDVMTATGKEAYLSEAENSVEGNVLISAVGDLNEALNKEPERQQQEGQDEEQNDPKDIVAKQMQDLFQSFENPRNVPELGNYKLSVTSFYNGHNPCELMGMLISTIAMHIDLAAPKVLPKEAHIQSKGQFNVLFSNIFFEAQYLNLEIRLFKEPLGDKEDQEEELELPFLYVCEITRLSGDSIYFRKLFNALVEEVNKVFYPNNLESDDDEDSGRRGSLDEFESKKNVESILTDEIGMV